MPGAQPLVDFISRVENATWEDVGATDEIRLDVPLQHEHLYPALPIAQQDDSRGISNRIHAADSVSANSTAEESPHRLEKSIPGLSSYCGTENGN